MENGCLALKQKESIHFGDFWHIHDDFAIKNATNIFSKAKKCSPTILYMIYLMAQSVSLVFLQKVKKMPPQWHIVHCHWKSIVHHSKLFKHSKFKFGFYNFKNGLFEYCHTLFFHSSAFTVGAANTHCVQKRGPTCQGIDAPRQYQHTLF
jgi:hypothetical protein